MMVFLLSISGFALTAPVAFLLLHLLCLMLLLLLFILLFILLLFPRT